MSRTAERVSSVRERLTSFTTVMVCNDVIRLRPVREQQQGIDTKPISVMAGHGVALGHLLSAEERSLPTDQVGAINAA